MPLAERGCVHPEQRGSLCPLWQQQWGTGLSVPHRKPLQCVHHKQMHREPGWLQSTSSQDQGATPAAQISASPQVNSLHPSATESCTDKAFVPQLGRSYPPFIFLAALQQSQACSSPAWGGIGDAGHSNTSSALNRGFWAPQVSGK